VNRLTTACPLDCYDSCSVKVDYNAESIKVYGDKEHPLTNGYLCPHLNHFLENKRIEKARYKGKEISLDEAKNILYEILQKHPSKENLLYRGSGNIGAMQEVSEHFFAQLGAYSTNGSLCDGAGQAAINESRGFNQAFTPHDIAQSEVVIVWGRNINTTNSHIMPFIKDKILIVIDPVATSIAKKADLHVQIMPRTDIHLALLLTRFLVIEDSHDSEFLQEYADEFNDFYELTQTIRIKSVLDEIGLSLGKIGEILRLINDKKVSILMGVGVQKYIEGADIVKAIDSFGAMLGLHNKKGCSVNFLGDSRRGIASPFMQNKNLVSKVDTPFSKFKTVFIQGANPLSQMPDTNRVEKELSQVENIVYFGLYENESSAIADLLIPAKNFLEKEDVRFSYSSNAALQSPKIVENNRGISEYDLAHYLCKKFSFSIDSEKYYIDYFKSFIDTKDGYVQIKNREENPYADGFSTDDDTFHFLDELEFEGCIGEKLYLITPKSHSSLNSQFKRDEYLYLHPIHGYSDEEEVEIYNEIGTVRLKVKNSDDLREDCVLIYSGTKGLNRLTSSQKSYEGNSAIYQELKINIKKVG